MWGFRDRQAICIDHHPAAAVAEGGPAIGFPEYILGGQLAGPHFFIAPKQIALGVISFGEQTIGQADGLYRFAIENGADLNPGFFLESFENGFGIDLVLSAIDDELVFSTGDPVRSGNEQKRREDNKGNQPSNSLERKPGLVLAKFILRPVTIWFWGVRILSHFDSRRRSGQRNHA